MLIRVGTGLFPQWKVEEWLLGDDDDDFKYALFFKHLEGLLEAAPQLTLQLYIVTKHIAAGRMSMDDWKGEQCRPYLSGCWMGKGVLIW